MHTQKQNKHTRDAQREEITVLVIHRNDQERTVFVKHFYFYFFTFYEEFGIYLIIFAKQ
jgi:hypothetical protein